MYKGIFWNLFGFSVWCCVVVGFVLYWCKGGEDVKRSGTKAHRGLQIALLLLYIPLSVFGVLCYMATESLMGETRAAVIVWTNLFAHIGLLMPLISAAGLWGANRLYAADRKRASYVVRCIPLCLFVFLWGIDAFVL